MNRFLNPVSGLILDSLGVTASGLTMNPICMMFDASPMMRKSTSSGRVMMPSSTTPCLKMDTTLTLVPFHMERLPRYEPTTLPSLFATVGM
ncbi:MAG: hypothetical protein BWZ01_03241 [Deltaproteobacteria bacterium ADurb.BinA179]|nr:MAG: hypothetical protein BWZ01_03241 [Deltaproteobacteria bacterium ADurb.BinA179]